MWGSCGNGRGGKLKTTLNGLPLKLASGGQQRKLCEQEFVKKQLRSVVESLTTSADACLRSTKRTLVGSCTTRRRTSLMLQSNETRLIVS